MRFLPVTRTGILLVTSQPSLYVDSSSGLWPMDFNRNSSTSSTRRQGSRPLDRAVKAPDDVETIHRLTDVPLAFECNPATELSRLKQANLLEDS